MDGITLSVELTYVRSLKHILVEKVEEYVYWINWKCEDINLIHDFLTLCISVGGGDPRHIIYNMSKYKQVENKRLEGRKKYRDARFELQGKSEVEIF